MDNDFLKYKKIYTAYINEVRGTIETLTDYKKLNSLSLGVGGGVNPPKCLPCHIDIPTLWLGQMP